MSLLLQELANKAHKLPPKERAELAHELIVSLDEVIDKLALSGAEGEVEAAWDAEIERRVKEIKSGKAKGRPAEEVLAEIQAKYS